MAQKTAASQWVMRLNKISQLSECIAVGNGDLVVNS